MSRRYLAVGASIVALQAVVFACARQPARPIDAPRARDEASVTEAPSDAGHDADTARWAKTVCEGVAPDAIVAEATPEVIEECYPKPRDRCASRVRVELASCASFARDLVEVTETIDGRDRGFIFDAPALGSGPSATTLTIPTPELGVHSYRIVAKAEGHPNAATRAVVVVRDPALERARREFCADLGGSVVFDGGRPPPPRDGVALEVRHTPCYGTCPSYTVALRTDGSVIYDGATNVRLRGVVIDLVPPAVVAILLARFDHAMGTPQHAEMHGHCVRSVDSSTANLTLQRNGRTYQLPVVNGCHHPEERALAEEIDRVTRSDRWVTGSPACRDRGLW